MYIMGFLLLHEGIYKRPDSNRERFLWKGVGNNKKYQMVKWEALATQFLRMFNRGERLV